MIDGGEASPGVTDFLKKYVDGPLEVVVATHPHADHIGGLASVLRTFKVFDVWTNGETSTSVTYSTFTAAVQTSGASVHTGRRGDKITTGELSFSVLNPVTLTGTTNNNSIVLSLDYGETSFLFEGDAEKEAEADMLGAGVVPRTQILKVGHHGSRTASSQPFLAAVQPEVAVYMAGVGNQYGHPHQETLNALSQIGAKVYGTDVNGTIEISTDGKTFTVQTSKPTSTSTPTLNPSPNPTTRLRPTELTLCTLPQVAPNTIVRVAATCPKAAYLLSGRKPSKRAIRRALYANLDNRWHYLSINRIRTDNNLFTKG